MLAEHETFRPLIEAFFINEEGITPNGTIVFTNGVRNNKVSIIENAHYSDLISGTSILNHKGVIYSMSQGVKI